MILWSKNNVTLGAVGKLNCNTHNVLKFALTWRCWKTNRTLASWSK